MDPALTARLLGVDEAALLRGGPPGSPPPDEKRARSQAGDGTLLGRLFESLVTQSVLVYAQSAEAGVLGP